jgi:hypothetical protein
VSSRFPRLGSPLRFALKPLDATTNETKPLILKVEHYTTSTRWLAMAENPQSIKIPQRPFSRLAFVSNGCLNFDRSFKTGGVGAMLRNKRALARLLTTGLIAVVIGGLLLSSQWHRTIKPIQRQVTTAPPGMMQLVRDEHDLVADMVRTQLAILDSGVDSKPIAAGERRLVIALR